MWLFCTEEKYDLYFYDYKVMFCGHSVQKQNYKQMFVAQKLKYLFHGK